MATVNRSTIECSQRAASDEAELARLAETEAYHRARVNSDDPEGTIASAYEARRIHRIRVAISH